MNFLWQYGPTGWFLVHESELKLWPSWEHEHANEEDIADDELGELLERLEWRRARNREDLEAGREPFFDVGDIDRAIEDVLQEQLARRENRPA